MNTRGNLANDAGKIQVNVGSTNVLRGYHAWNMRGFFAWGEENHQSTLTVLYRNLVEN